MSDSFLSSSIARSCRSRLSVSDNLTVTSAMHFSAMAGHTNKKAARYAHRRQASTCSLRGGALVTGCWHSGCLPFGCRLAGAEFGGCGKLIAQREQFQHPIRAIRRTAILPTGNSRLAYSCPALNLKLRKPVRSNFGND
jgi:hypothetical protein